MPLQYRTPTVPEGWASSRDTHDAVAMAIHAIASHHRTPEAIWEAPERAEWEQVAIAVENYVDNDVFAAEPDGRYQWGNEVIRLGAVEDPE